MRIYLGLAVSVLLLSSACSGDSPATEQAVVGQFVNIDLTGSTRDADVARGSISEDDFWGVITVELEDGTYVKATLTNQLAPQLGLTVPRSKAEQPPLPGQPLPHYEYRWGASVQVVPQEASDYWRVVTVTAGD